MSTIQAKLLGNLSLTSISVAAASTRAELANSHGDSPSLSKLLL